MPLYEYRCEACGDREEKLQGLSAPEQHDCPACGAQEGMRRQISRAAFALAGGGWYAQGYGAGSPAAPVPARGQKIGRKALDKFRVQRYNYFRALRKCLSGSMVEHITRNDEVVGSIPTSSSRKAVFRLEHGFFLSASTSKKSELWNLTFHRLCQNIINN